MKITIPAESYPLLRAAQVCAAKDDVREYLNGVLVEPDKGRVTGCDGHRLFRAVCFEPCDEPPFIASLPTLPARKNVAVEIMKVAEDGGIAYVGGKPVAWQACEGRYPDVDRVLPDKVDESKPTGAFNPDLLSPLVKAMGAAGCYLAPNKDSGGAYRVEFVGSDVHAAYDCVVMGMRK